MLQCLFLAISVSLLLAIVLEREGYLEGIIPQSLNCNHLNRDTKYLPGFHSAPVMAHVTLTQVSLGVFPSPFAAIMITSMLKDINAEEKDTITFEVTVNHEGISYKWLKNGVEIKSTDRCQMRTKKLTHSLNIRNVHFGDAAEYTFVAGKATSTATLYVEGTAS